MINKYWVIYGLKLCLLIYYRNELFNWYQIEPNVELIHVACMQVELVRIRIHLKCIYSIPRLRESNEIEFYLLYKHTHTPGKRWEELVFYCRFA